MILFAEVLFKVIGYLLVFVGLWKAAWPFLRDARRFRLRKNRIRKIQRKGQAEVYRRKERPLFVHIRKLVYALSKKDADQRLSYFYGMTLGSFIVTMTTLVLLLKSFMLPLLVAVTVASLPYILLRFRLANLRIEASIALMKEFHLILQSYQQNKDVYHTLMAVSPELRDKWLRNAFQRLLSSMQKDRSDEAFVEAVQLLSFTVGSSFAARLANLLIKSYREQVDISEALFDLHMDLQKREKDMAAMKTKRMETIVLGFLPIVILPIFVVMAYRMSMQYSMSYMLDNSNALATLVLAFVLSVLSALFAFLFSKPKADF
ncbi:type II secretion system F family protein [Planococcus lenghuensis]|uniref:Type II secretion system protein GspF domain-containing protein n=1 Tax=Planococcus lenghuensis TaxID=2213202 RepID=A0A1Q2L4L0_9BACL|nr:type II secretion system F family protein [Planococcus lenghuensis]AQQ55353.1 hypothetical protein B0X71_19465 [Planococcus lenghuensis]